MTAKWLIPTLGYVLLVGGLGVTGRLAQRTLGWQDLVVWSGVGYLAVTAVFLATGQARLRFTVDGRWAMASAALAISGLIMLYVALATGEATKVVTVSAAYPAATLVLAALFLSEPITVARLVGVALVIGGVVVITVAH